jgi:hypothetical protein
MPLLNVRFGRLADEQPMSALGRKQTSALMSGMGGEQTLVAPN